MTARRHLWLGIRRALPLMVGAIPFGLITGATAAGDGLSTPMASAMSVLIFAGAAQLSVLELLRADAPALVAIATAVVINLRLMMYSAALAPHFRGQPAATRGLLAYLLTDQSFALSVIRFDEQEGRSHRAWFTLGASLPLWVAWQVTTVVGAAAGAAVPPSWSLDFAVPLMFIAMAVPALKTRHAVVACGVSVAVALVSVSAPWGTGLLLAAGAGVTAAMASERWAP